MTSRSVLTYNKCWPAIFVIMKEKVKSKSINIVQQRYLSSSTSGGVDKTALYDFHVRHGGKMVNFGGYSLPVQYTDQSITASHLHTRSHASIFDVSHMLQTYIRGKDAISSLEALCTADLQNISNNSGTLTVFTNNSGGILDDLIINRISDRELYVVSNAAMKQQDQQLMESMKVKGKDIHIEFLAPSEQSLIALQGPKAIEALSKLAPKTDLKQLYFMNTIEAIDVAGVPHCRITRCGYTGEDGVEISIPSHKVEHVTESLLEQKEQQVKLAGLGARDSLRLEAGLCLYGSDINAETTPIEAGLAWLVSKRRRQELNFPGADIIIKQIKMGVQKRRIGLKMLSDGSGIGASAVKSPPYRAGTQIFSNNNCVGHVTSGCPSPTLQYNIAMGYIAEDLKQPGTKVQVKIRDRFYNSEIVKMPFVNANYYLKSK